MFLSLEQRILTKSLSAWLIISAGWLLAPACFLNPLACQAAEGEERANPGAIQFNRDEGDGFRLEVRQAPLARIVSLLQEKTGMKIHYSVLPDGPVTTTCVGASPKQLLECLLAAKSDLVFRYPRNSKADSANQPTEAWILGAKYSTGLTPVVEICSKQAEPEAKEAAEPNRTDELLIKAKAKNPSERVAAIGELLSEGRPGDAAVREVLEQALNDKDAKVRAQAISTYANREGEKAFGALQEALHDSDAWVRQMALGSTDDKTLLQQAVNDSEESVRSLAEQKLKALEKQKQTDE